MGWGVPSPSHAQSRHFLFPEAFPDSAATTGGGFAAAVLCPALALADPELGPGVNVRCELPRNCPISQFREHSHVPLHLGRGLSAVSQTGTHALV